MLAILLSMRKARLSILLREDLLVGFRSRGLTSLSGAIEEFLEVFLSAIPPENRKRSAKETRELVRRFLKGRPVQDSPSNQQELLQQLMSFIQTLQTPSQPSQAFRPQPQQTFQPSPPPSPQPQYQPPPSQPQPQYQQPPQPKPTVQEQKPKPKISTREILRAVREHAIEHGVPPELVDYERILEEARREAEEDEEK
jgi:outer membrane biosynthesis protein TonB